MPTTKSVCKTCSAEIEWLREAGCWTRTTAVRDSIGNMCFHCNPREHDQGMDLTRHIPINALERMVMEFYLSTET